MFFIRTNDQVKIAVYDLNPCGSETILLIHGWPLSHQIFEYQESLLTANGFRVVSMDLRGFGASDAPACGYGYDRMADDIYTVVRALNLRCFTLVGFSMGGGIVTRYMGRYNGYGVKRLVLLGAASPRFTQCSDFPYGVTREAVDAWISQASTDRAQLCEQFGSMLFASPQSSAIVDWPPASQPFKPPVRCAMRTAAPISPKFVYRPAFFMAGRTLSFHLSWRLFNSHAFQARSFSHLKTAATLYFTTSCAASINSSSPFCAHLYVEIRRPKPGSNLIHKFFSHCFDYSKTPSTIALYTMSIPNSKAGAGGRNTGPIPANQTVLPARDLYILFHISPLFLSSTLWHGPPAMPARTRKRPPNCMDGRFVRLAS